MYTLYVCVYIIYVCNNVCMYVYVYIIYVCVHMYVYVNEWFYNILGHVLCSRIISLFRWNFLFGSQAHIGCEKVHWVISNGCKKSFFQWRS